MLQRSMPLISICSTIIHTYAQKLYRTGVTKVRIPQTTEMTNDKKKEIIKNQSTANGSVGSSMSGEKS